MGDSITVLLDKLHDLVDEFESGSKKCSAGGGRDKKCAMRSIRFVKTFLFYHRSVVDDSLMRLVSDTNRHFRWLVYEIQQVSECEHHHLSSALSQCMATIRKLHSLVARMYGRLMKAPHSAAFVDGVNVFDEFSESVQLYLMNIPKEPIGWGRSSRGYWEVEENYENAVHMLQRFRHFVISFSKQCTDQKKLQSLLAPAAALVFSILNAAFKTDVHKTFSAEKEEYIFSSSFDMSRKLSFQNQDAMEVYLGVLSANVEIMRATKPSSGGPFDSMVQSAHNQASILGQILDFQITDIVVDDSDDHGPGELQVLLKEGYAAAFREAGSIFSCIPDDHDTVLSNLLYRLDLIKGQIFVLQVHTHNKASSNRTATIREAFRLLCRFFEMPAVYMEDVERCILALIEAFLREAGSLRDSSQRMQFSETSLAIFKIFKADAMLMALTDCTPNLKFVAAGFRMEALHKSLMFLRDLLSTNCGSFEGQFPSQDFLPLFNNFPKSDGEVFSRHLLGKLNDFVSEKPDFITFSRDQVEALLRELELFVSLLMDARRKYCKNKDLVSRVTCLIYCAEYIIDMFILGSVPLCYHQLVIYVATEEAKLIKAHILDCCDGQENFESSFQNGPFTSGLEISSASNLRTDEVIVGFEDHASIIVDQLKTGSRRLHIVSVVGMAGIGKTTLAKKVYSSPSIRRHFSVCAVASVSQIYRKRELLLDILSDFVDVSDDMRNEDDNDLAHMVFRSLKGKRYLIVLDDIWSMDHWRSLSLSFPDDNTGSRILFTTRVRGMAMEANPARQPYVLPLLSPLQSWGLLQEKLFQGGECPEKLVEVGKLVAQHCRGLPLAIVVVSGILKRTEMKKDQWEGIAQHLRSLLADDQETQFTSILEFSYNHLPSYLKPCYLYLGSFLEDQEIPSRKLLWLWIAEGFIPKKDCRSLEETAEGYLVELINRSLVMEAKRSSSGGTKTCRIHDMLCDLCLKKCKEENFMQLILLNSSDYPLTGLQYRLCIHSTKLKFVQLRPSASHVHSLLFFATDSTQENSPYDISSIFEYFRFVRVMDLEPMKASIFPIGTDRLLCLNYLSIKGNMKSVPSSISKLWNLETLIVKGTSGAVALPSTLWSMATLRHVHVRPQACLTLSGTELENAKVLEKLTTFSSPAISDSRKEFENILKRCIRLKKLRCIFLEWRDNSSRKCNLFSAMEILIQLESLNVFYMGRTFPCEFSFPPNLKKLTLSKCCFPWDHISVICQLSNLEVLKLLFRAFEGDNWELGEEEFRKLKFLKLETLKLKNWNASPDNFPELQMLVLSSCYFLKEVPSGFGEVPTLQMIEVSWCSQAAADSVEAVMDQQVETWSMEIRTSK